jgi:salicylate hydroxylase
MIQITVVGAGMGGLAAAMACARTGCAVTVLEQSVVLAEAGAGIQLGPNAVKVLDQWGLGARLREVTARPAGLQVLDSCNGKALGYLDLAYRMRTHYGADYLTLHRSDLQQLLLDGAKGLGVVLELGIPVTGYATGDDRVFAHSATGRAFAAHALLGCDGIWSRVRQQMLQDGLPQATGHFAYRALIARPNVPLAVPRDRITVWLGVDWHVVAYPVRAGQWFNVVVIEGRRNANPDEAGSEAAKDWSVDANASHLRERLTGQHRDLQALIESAGQWTRWTLHAHAPLTGAHQMAQGRVALMGDAAHAMRPYLAQGAAMALEDAAMLETVWRQGPKVAPVALQAYAQARWQRNALVQQKAERNGKIFHARGPVRWARNMALRWGGTGVMDTPWLYRHA